MIDIFRPEEVIPEWTVKEEHRYYKVVDSFYIVSIGFLNPALDPNKYQEITEEEYLMIEEAMNARPELKDGFINMLRADTLEWEDIALPAPEEPEETDMEFLMEYLADQEERICLLELGITEEEL